MNTEIAKNTSFNLSSINTITFIKAKIINFISETLSKKKSFYQKSILSKFYKEGYEKYIFIEKLGMYILLRKGGSITKYNGIYYKQTNFAVVEKNKIEYFSDMKNLQNFYTNKKNLQGDQLADLRLSSEKIKISK